MGAVFTAFEQMEHSHPPCPPSSLQNQDLPELEEHKPSSWTSRPDRSAQQWSKEMMDSFVVAANQSFKESKNPTNSEDAKKQDEHNSSNEVSGFEHHNKQPEYKMVKEDQGSVPPFSSGLSEYIQDPDKLGYIEVRHHPKDEE